MTAAQMIIAEEMDLDPDQVVVTPADACPIPPSPTDGLDTTF